MEASRDIHCPRSTALIIVLAIALALALAIAVTLMLAFPPVHALAV